MGQCIELEVLTSRGLRSSRKPHCHNWLTPYFAFSVFPFWLKTSSIRNNIQNRSSSQCEWSTTLTKGTIRSLLGKRYISFNGPKGLAYRLTTDWFEKSLSLYFESCDKILRFHGCSPAFFVARGLGNLKVSIISNVGGTNHYIYWDRLLRVLTSTGWTPLKLRWQLLSFPADHWQKSWKKWRNSFCPHHPITPRSSEAFLGSGGSAST